MEQDKNYNPRQILQALKKRGKNKIYAYTVEISIPVEYVLDMIQNRNNPAWTPPAKTPYSVTQSFDDLAEAEHYMTMSRLAGHDPRLIDNNE